jgi:hypothetical protein
MQTTKTEKEFDCVRVFRGIKDRIDREMAGMTFEQFKSHISQDPWRPRQSNRGRSPDEQLTGVPAK